MKEQTYRLRKNITNKKLVSFGVVSSYFIEELRRGFTVRRWRDGTWNGKTIRTADTSTTMALPYYAIAKKK